jgi:hypothetical protein
MAGRKVAEHPAASGMAPTVTGSTLGRLSPERRARALMQCFNARSNARAALRPRSSKTINPALHGGLIAIRHVHHPDHYQSVERRVVSVWMLVKIGPDAGDRVRKVASLDVFERSPFAPSEMLVPRQCASIVFPT